MSALYRLHYRAQKSQDIPQTAWNSAIALCISNIRKAQSSGRILTAALYYYGDMLFFYYESIGEKLITKEPIQIAGLTDTSDCPGSVLPESGEDIQADIIRPDILLAPLSPMLRPWPGQTGERLWVHMYHIYYHSVPESPEDWKRTGVVQQRRGRIAFLRLEKLFSYVYFHKAIVDEGLLLGDKYQSIALHENILFSYFEEPKTMVNIRNDAERESQVIREWLAADPESHFIHMPQGEGGNFMFLPAYFALGTEQEEIDESL